MGRKIFGISAAALIGATALAFAQLDGKFEEAQKFVAAAKNAGKTIVVPGKVLATGVAGAKIEVACISCSAAARQKIVKAGGKVISIKQLAQAKPEASKMVIIA